MDYQTACRYLEQVRQQKGMVLGLENMRRLMELLGNPQDRVKFIQVAGTNGKGSVTAFLAGILREAGYRTGRYVSPAVFSFEEQYQADGRDISREKAAEGISVIAEAAGRMEVMPTAFELETALAFWYFAEEGCDIAVLETGVGGDEDATNIVTTTVCSVLTSISMDHRRILGDTLEEIAAHKAGIIKPGVPAVCIEYGSGRATKIIRSRCEKQQAPLTVVRSEEVRMLWSTKRETVLSYGDFEGLSIHQPGIYQKDNAALAAAAASVLGIAEDAIRRGLAGTVWRGRFEFVCFDPDIVLDGAHNEDGVRSLRASVDLYFGARPVTYVMGVLADKDYEEEIALLLGRAARVYTVTPDSPRACDKAVLQAAISRRFPQLKVTCSKSVREALTQAVKAGGPVVVCGTLTILKSAAEWVREQAR